MLTPHLLRLAATIALAFVAPAWAQQQPPMSAGLVNQLQMSRSKNNSLPWASSTALRDRRPGTIYAKPWTGFAGPTNSSGAWKR
jgi:hypothetical protein